MIGSQEFRRRAENIRLLVLDVDGTLTDGSILLDHEGNEIKAFNVRDGFAIHCWRFHGFHSAVITGRSAPAVELRCRELGIAHVVQGVGEKGPALEELTNRLGVQLTETAAMGDDLPDLPILTRVGLSAAVADADAEVKSRVHWVSSRRGGQGAVREWIELLLKARGIWEQTVEHYAGMPICDD